jgi:hypothetical protein
MSRSSRVKDPFGSGIYFGILVNEALDLRVDIRGILGKRLLLAIFLILRDRLIKLLKLGACVLTMSVGFRRMVFSIPRSSLHL